MNTGSYIQPEIILSKAAIMVGDREYKSLPRGFYYSLIQQAFEKLALDTFFDEKRKDIDVDGGLVYSLPDDCFNVENIYMFSGDICNISASHKVWWKRNYFTQGKGYIASDKGNHNYNDPFYESHSNNVRTYGTQVTTRMNDNVENRLFYNIQMGNLMISSSCLNAGNKIHIHYRGTGCKIGDAPIIPIFLREAMEDYVITEALLARMANDTGDIRKWQTLYATHLSKLNHPYDGSWAKAEMKVKSLNSSQKSDLKEYLSRGAWASGF